MTYFAFCLPCEGTVPMEDLMAFWNAPTVAKPQRLLLLTQCEKKHTNPNVRLLTKRGPGANVIFLARSGEGYESLIFF